jgi:flagellar biosynthetic protein FliR
VKLDESWIFAFFLVFVRSSAMFLVSPLFGASVAPRIRILFCVMFSFALTSIIQPYMPPIPQSIYGLLANVAHEAFVGILIGLSIQLLMMAAQMAGAIMDMQLGFNSMQMFNPNLGTTTTIMGQFHFLLFFVLFLMMNGHHTMIAAFVDSYQMRTAIGLGDLGAAKTGVVTLISTLMLLAVQISAPVAAVSFIVDAASGVINKSIPQMPVFMVTMGAKASLGVVALALGLPLLTVATQSGIEHTMLHLYKILAIKGGQ